jgi:hypothetical protein
MKFFIIANKVVCDGIYKRTCIYSLTNLYSSQNIISDQVKEDEVGRACSTHEEKRNAYRILMGRPERKRPLGRPKHKCENNIKIDYR